MKPEPKPDLKKFHNALQDNSLAPDSPYYVPFPKEMDDGDPIQKMATQISWSEAASVSLLSGQRGTGKSTELRRLKQILEQDSCVVFVCDMLSYMNLTKPIEVSDFLISVMAALSEAAQKILGDDPSKLKFWERIVNFLNQEVKIDDIKIEADAGAAKAGFAASLKDDPTFKERLQAGLRGHVARITRESHQFSIEVVELVRQKFNDPDKKVVILVDSFERLRGVGEEAEKVYSSVVNLFSGHADKLRLPLLHVVYTIPPYLTPLAPNTGRFLGGGPLYCLPSVHVLKRDGNPDKQGLKIMEQIISKRWNEWEKVFTKSQIHNLARASGGDIRDFFRLVRDCLVSANSRDIDLPVDDKTIKDVKNHLRRNMLPIAKEDLNWLRRIAKSHEPELEKKDDLNQLAYFFDSSLVLNYRNGDDWYGVHPLLTKELEKDSE